MKRYHNIIILLFTIAGFCFPSCVDESVTPEPSVTEPEEPYIDPKLPEEIRNGFSISFNMSLESMGGENTRTSNAELMDIDNFVDLEKVRVLFFVCAKDVSDKETSVADTAHIKYYSSAGNPNDKPYMAGKNDHFLFESKSRWVSILQDDESTTASWQVTAPVFTYGNNDEYRWEDIRYALTHYPFKVVVLANRPDYVNFGNFDSKFSGEVHFNTGRGPTWGPNDTWIPKERRTTADNAVNWDEKPIINDLHHCQWDVVYASKNSGDKSSSNIPYGGAGVYNFIMENPKPNDRDPVPQPDPNNLDDPIHKQNRMGAFSNWTRKEDFGKGKEENAYFLPDKSSQAIPMYGVQVFDPIPDWREGTPFNISERNHGQSGELIRKNIFLLRSLVKLELKIPKQMEQNGRMVPITITEPYIRYSNVMARCEPLDVATPTERLWHEEDWTSSDYCEWKNIYDYGPIINGDLGQGNVETLDARLYWFYGAWRDWWHFNYNKGIQYGVNPENGELFKGKGAPYPRIFNPVVQRNDEVRLDLCLIDDEDFWYYVIYTGERNINDPTQFGQTDSFNAENAKAVYFRFIANGTTYIVPTANFTGTNLASTFHFTDGSENSNVSTAGSAKSYFSQMAKKTNPETEDWNWPFLRNHVYTFTVRSFGSFSDSGGIDVKVVSTEKRTAPTLTFN